MSIKAWDDCIDHGRKIGKNAYASCYFNGKYMDQHVRALLAAGPRPPGMRALHRCDNKRCINPQHLYWGSQADNIRDTEGKAGSRVRTRVLLDIEVVEVRSFPGTAAEIAAHYGVTAQAIKQILNGTRRASAQGV